MAGAERVPVRVMVFNIEEGGALVDLGQVIEAIRLANPDVVALQEAIGNTARIAESLGWPFASARSQVLSVHPFVDRDDGAVDVEIRPRLGFRLVSAHLPSDPYGPSAAAATGDAAAVVSLERRVRLPVIERVLSPHARSPHDVPTFLVGDFNAPSHLDWTTATVGSRPHLTTTIDWPVSRAIEAAGFRDTWREVHPDPLADPGLTWWARRPRTGGYEPGPDAPEDRIDMVFVAGAATTLASEIVGEAGRDGVHIGLDPWPSDHRAVVSTCLVTLAPLDMGPARPALAGASLDRPVGPVTVATSSRSYRVGEPIDVSWSGGPGYRWDWIAVFAAPAARLADRHLIWRHTGARRDGTVLLDADAAIVDQSSIGGHWPLPPGAYEAIYLLDDGPEPLGRATFTIEA